MTGVSGRTVSRSVHIETYGFRYVPNRHVPDSNGASLPTPVGAGPAASVTDVALQTARAPGACQLRSYVEVAGFPSSPHFR